MKLTSDFEHNGIIPRKYTCDGEDIAPILNVSEVKSEAKELVLIVDDPDAPMKDTWVHWVVYNIPADTIVIDENNLPEGTTLGMTDFGFSNWGGPCPPNGSHRYYFNLYALDKQLNLEKGLTKKQVEEIIAPHVIDKAQLMGNYKRP